MSTHERPPTRPRLTGVFDAQSAHVHAKGLPPPPPIVVAGGLWAAATYSGTSIAFGPSCPPHCPATWLHSCVCHLSRANAATHTLLNRQECTGRWWRRHMDLEMPRGARHHARACGGALGGTPRRVRTSPAGSYMHDAGATRRGKVVRDRMLRHAELVGSTHAPPPPPTIAGRGYYRPPQL